MITEDTSLPPSENPTGETPPAKPKRQRIRLNRLVAQRQRRTVRQTRRVSLKSLRSRLQAKLGELDRDTLKKILVGCGVAAAVVAAVILAAKFLPLGVALLALLGLGVLLRLLERLPYMPRPFGP
jgi:Flp pilus assembly protein TadB